MILVKVVKLVVDVDWCRDITIDYDGLFAFWVIFASSYWALVIILQDDALDALTHDV